MAAPTAPSLFVMHGAREAVASGAVHIEEQVTALEQAVTENPGLAFDLAKTIVESTCKAILSDRQATYDNRWDLPRLVKETCGRLQLVPVNLAAEGDVTESVRKTIRGLQTVIHGICELRNSHGFASHGKDPAFRQLDTVHALLVARAADAIVSFLYKMHRGEAGTAKSEALQYSNYPEYNRYIDEVNEPVRIFDLLYKPSEVLFHVDPQAYEEYLGTFEPDSTEEDS